jgi:hypothetical protein
MASVSFLTWLFYNTIHVDCAAHFCLLQCRTLATAHLHLVATLSSSR